MIEEEDDETLESLRRLPWDENQDVSKWFQAAVLDLDMHANYECIDSIASLLSNLAHYRNDVVHEVVDCLLEQIQTGFEQTDWQQAPLRVRQMKLLAEMYIYRTIETVELLEMLYHLIGFGSATSNGVSTSAHVFQLLERQQALKSSGQQNGVTVMPTLSEESEEANQSSIQLPKEIIDPASTDDDPSDYFRLKLVCVLLETAGPVFAKGARKAKMDRFLLFFQRYILCKNELPLRVEYFVQDAFEQIRPAEKLKKNFPTKIFGYLFTEMRGKMFELQP